MTHLSCGYLAQAYSVEILTYPSSLLIRRPEVLSRFNVLVARYQSLVGELRVRKDWMYESLVAPSSVIVQAPDYIPHMLLRTKLEPDVDTENAALLLSRAPADPVNYLDQSAVAELVDTLEAQMEEHDKLIADILMQMDGRAQELKTRLPPDAQGAAPVEENESEAKRILERTLMWEASGPRAWEDGKAKPAWRPSGL
ncbi:hypothetical protein HKX48_004157 [Thoreauomyces humboldtii]|nr:hypothetical protein HKX48_004157 [Thoreauomyces humboldtii]